MRGDSGVLTYLRLRKEIVDKKQLRPEGADIHCMNALNSAERTVLLSGLIAQFYVHRQISEPLMLDGAAFYKEFRGFNVTVGAQAVKWFKEPGDMLHGRRYFQSIISKFIVH